MCTARKEEKEETHVIKRKLSCTLLTQPFVQDDNKLVLLHKLLANCLKVEIPLIRSSRHYHTMSFGLVHIGRVKMSLSQSRLIYVDLFDIHYSFYDLTEYILSLH